MPWVNFHSHSLSRDGTATPGEYIAAAIDKGFSPAKILAALGFRTIRILSGRMWKDIGFSED